MRNINRFFFPLVVLLCAVVASPRAAHADDAILTTSGRLDLDSMTNVASGLQSGPASSALFQWGGTLNTGAAHWWPGGRIEFSVEGVRSAGHLPARTGAIQLPSNEWAPNFLRVYQLTYAQNLGPAELRAGVMDLNQYFEASDVAGLLHNGTFGMAPNFSANFNVPSFPNPGLGLMGNWRFSPEWQARTGVWQGNPPGLAGALHDGALVIGEAERDWPGAAADDEPRADLKFGVWHYRQGDRSLGPTISGGYLVGEMRWKAGERQWGAFVMAGTTPARVNLVTEFLGGGVLVTGLLPGRSQDQFSLGFGRVNLRAPHPEIVAEAVYSWQLTSAVSVQPDVQWLGHPGGTNSNALVAGVRVHITF